MNLFRMPPVSAAVSYLPAQRQILRQVVKYSEVLPLLGLIKFLNAVAHAQQEV